MGFFITHFHELPAGLPITHLPTISKCSYVSLVSLISEKAGRYQRPRKQRLLSPLSKMRHVISEALEVQLHRRLASPHQPHVADS